MVELVDVVSLPCVFHAVVRELAVHHHEVQSGADISRVDEDVIHEVGPLPASDDRDRVEPERNVLADEIDDRSLKEEASLTL